MNFSVTILGSGSAAPTSNRGLTSQYVFCRNRHILIDCGEGTQMQIRKFKIKFQRIEHVLISHMHGDHYFGLVGLLSSMHLMGREKSINVYGPESLEEILKLQLNHRGAKLGYEIIFHKIDSDIAGCLYEDEKIKIDHFPLEHRIPTSGFVITEKPGERKLIADKAEADHVPIAFYHRLKKGEDPVDEEGNVYNHMDYTLPSETPRSYAFCSDTKFSESILPFISNVDLLYHEATFTTEHSERAKKTMHSTAAQAAEIAKKANVNRLLLGHISARYDNATGHELEAREIFQESVVAEDGQSYEV